MPSIPEWPKSPGPRVLTLVGNDLTIDARARKTASSLARAGFSVISIGIDSLGDKARTEDIEGALVWRLTPPTNPKISPRRLRLSRPELRDWALHRLITNRQRLQLRRRYHTAKRISASKQDAHWVRAVGNLLAQLLRLLRVSQDERARMRDGVDRRLRHLDRSLRFGPSKLILVTEQRFTGLLSLLHRALARPSSREVKRGNWRRDLPELHRYEAAIGGLVDALKPELIHVHDVFHIGLAARAKARAEHDDGRVRVVYDAHEYIPGLPTDPRRRAAYTDLEAEYIGHVDSVITVSQGLADLLRSSHGVEASVVMNAPDLDASVEVPALRDTLGLPESATLAVYIGGVAPHRGGDLMLDAIAALPDIHLVFITNTRSGYVAELGDIAVARGISDRIHFAPYVPQEGIIAYLRSADIGVIPLSRDVINYEVALPNKLFQSIHAGLPVVVSDSPEMATFVARHGIGRVFDGRDPMSLAEALSDIATHYETYKRTIESADLTPYTWKSQIEILLNVYESVGIALR